MYGSNLNRTYGGNKQIIIDSRNDLIYRICEYMHVRSMLNK